MSIEYIYIYMCVRVIYTNVTILG